MTMDRCNYVRINYYQLYNNYVIFKVNFMYFLKSFLRLYHLISFIKIALCNLLCKIISIISVGKKIKSSTIFNSSLKFFNFIIELKISLISHIYFYLFI